MKIVLLGATGQLGMEWQQFIRYETPVHYKLLPYTSAQLDITDYKKVRDELEAQKPDVVVNCAAFTDVDGAEDRKIKAHKINAEAVSNLAEMSAEIGFKLVHYSTDYVFPGKREDHHKFPEGYLEDHPADPINYYGRTKWEGEEAIRQSASNYLIIRVSWLCGQFGSNFVKTMLRLGDERDKLQVVNDQWGSPTYAEDVVRNSLHLLNSDQTGTFHLTSRGLISWFDFAQAIFDECGFEIVVEPVNSDAYPTKAKRPHFSKLSTKKLEAVPGSVISEWRDGLRNLLYKIEGR
ncbi:MAG: dTDP-4-dehydrorhamnose reductase [Balneolaceae bacterium]|jgi:dTDP-4-dehydrorhamnose reductase